MKRQGKKGKGFTHNHFLLVSKKGNQYHEGFTLWSLGWKILKIMNYWVIFIFRFPLRIQQNFINWQLKEDKIKLEISSKAGDLWPSISLHLDSEDGQGAFPTYIWFFFFFCLNFHTERTKKWAIPRNPKNNPKFDWTKIYKNIKI